MAVKKKDESKVVVQNVINSNFDIRIVHKHEGYGKKRRITTSSYGIFRGKHNVKSGFKNTGLAVAYIIANKHDYNKKTRKL